MVLSVALVAVLRLVSASLEVLLADEELLVLREEG
jgi:hypothetical protein